MKKLLQNFVCLAMILLAANLLFSNTASAQTTYYYKGTGALNVTTNWGLNTNGSGANPPNFTTANRIYNVRNTAAVSTSGGTWTVSGANSKIVVGDGTNALNLTIATRIIGTVDVSALSTLTVTNVNVPTLGTLHSTSTEVFNATSNQNIPAVTYGNLVYSGTARGTMAGSCNIAGNFSCTSGNFRFNSTNTARTFNIAGNFTMSSTGTIELGGGNANSVINLSGNFSKTNGVVTTSGATTTSKFNLLGTNKTLQSIGGTIMKWVDFTIASGSVYTLSGNFNIDGSAAKQSVFTVSNGGKLTCGANNIIGTAAPAANNAFILSSGGTLEIGSAAGITTAGNASGNIQSLVRTFNATANYAYTGSVNQASGNALTAANNLIMNNSAGIVLSVNAAVSGILTLTSGNIDCSTNTLSVTNNAVGAIARTSGHVIGNLRRAVATGTNTYNYPVGTATGYTPASIAFSSVGTGGNLTVKSTDGVSGTYPSALHGTKRLNRYWTITNSGISGFTANASFTFLPGDLGGGASASSLKAYSSITGPVYNYPAIADQLIGGTTYNYNNIATFGEYGAGECKGTLAPTFTKTMASSCGGGVDGTITVTPAGGTAPYTYSWTSTPAGFSASTAAITGLSTRDYTVIVSEVTTCSSTIPDITIWKALTPTLTNNGGITGSCAPTGYIILYAGNGVGPYTYSIDGITYQASNTFNNLNGGTYTGYVKDLGGCIGTKPNIVVGSAAPINVTSYSRSASSCGNNGSIELYRTGGIPPYTYSINDVTYQASNVFTNLAGGTYTGWVKDSKGCKSSQAGIVVAKASALTVTAIKTNTTSCGNDGTIQLNGVGGVPPYTYSKTGASGPYQSGNIFTGLAAGNYTCWIQDSKACKNLVAVTIGTSAAMVVTATTSGAGGCGNAGIIQLFKTGGFSPYTYSIDNITYQSSSLFTGLPGGTYTGWVKDAKGCTASKTNIIVTQVSGLSLTESHTNSSTCTNDGTIQLRPLGGVAPYTFSLDDITYQSSQHFPGLAPNNYVGWVKDVNGCKLSINVTVSQNPINVTSYAAPASSCSASDGSVQLFKTGGVGPYTYSLDGNTYQSSNVFNNLTFGSYTGYVKDSKACIGTMVNINVGPGCSSRNGNEIPVATVPLSKAMPQDVKEYAALSIQAYPNPSVTEFTLSMTGFDVGNVNIIVTDIMGRKVYSTSGKSNRQYHFGSGFIAGIYNVQVIQGDKKQSIKIIRE